jgi:hypothetical protein
MLLVGSSVFVCLWHLCCKQAAAAKARIGALYTFGQPRVGDYEFLCHLSVSLLEPSASSSKVAGNTAAPTAADAGSSSSRLRGLWGGAGKQQEEAAGPPLTSRYIRVVNTYDIVPHSEKYLLCSLLCAKHGTKCVLQLLASHACIVRCFVCKAAVLSSASLQVPGLPFWQLNKCYLHLMVCLFVGTAVTT